MAAGQGESGGHLRMTDPVLRSRQTVPGALQIYYPVAPRCPPAGDLRHYHHQPGGVEGRADAAQIPPNPYLATSQGPLYIGHQVGEQICCKRPVQEHVRQQGHKATSPSFDKIQKMMVANSRLTGMHTHLKEGERWQGRRGQIEMNGMLERKPGQRIQVSSGRLNMPRAQPAGFRPALGLILLGRRKSGKSSAGNMILNTRAFQTDTKTVRCSAAQGTVSGRSVTVVDTPGWSLFGLADPDQVKREMSRSVSLCPVGSRVAFLLAVPVDSFGEKHRRAVEVYLSALGNGVWRSTVVLFTYGAQLRGKTVEKHAERKGKPLQWVLDRCGHRHHVFHTNAGDEREVTQLLEMVELL